MGNRVLIERAKLIMQLRAKGPGPAPKDDGMCFFPFEEDLSNYINEALVIVSSGLTILFFSNYHVWQWLLELSPKHHPVYKDKLFKLLWVIIYVQNKEINQFMSELFLEYQSLFVASTSNFWWDPVRKVSFAAYIGNFMANSYPLHDGTRIFVSDTTMKLKMKNKCVDKFCSISPKLERCQALIDFTLFDLELSGHNIGCWLEDAHILVGCLSGYIGSHTVDGASNAGTAVEELQWNTGNERTTQIVTSKCDAH